MPRLSVNPNAYVRPSPTRGMLGGVAQATADAVAMCETSGLFDVVIVETVGVGQSETSVRSTVDCM